MMRTIPSAHLYASKYETSLGEFITNLFGTQIDQDIIPQLAAPIREGGLGLATCTQNLNQEQHSLSLSVCTNFIE